VNWYSELGGVDRTIVIAHAGLVLLLSWHLFLGGLRGPRSLPEAVRDGLFGYDVRYDAVPAVLRPLGRHLRAEGALRDQAGMPRRFPQWLDRLAAAYPAARRGDREAAYEVGVIVGAFAGDRSRQELLRAVKADLETGSDLRLLLPEVGVDHQVFQSTPIGPVKFIGTGNRIRRTWCLGILSPGGGPVRLPDGRFALAVCD
jgi:hypothetical protein